MVNQPGGGGGICSPAPPPKWADAGRNWSSLRPGAGGNISAEIVAARPTATDAIAARLASSIPRSSRTCSMRPGLRRSASSSTSGGAGTPLAAVRNVKQLIALAKARPGELNLSSSGVGALGHLSGALFNSITGTNIVHVPYKGAGPAIVDLVAGHVQMSFVSIPAVVGHVQSGRLRMLAQCGATRFSSFPDLPTMVESGVPGFVVSSGFSFLGPAGMPQPIVDKLNGALAQTLRDPAIRKALIDRSATRWARRAR